MAKMTIREMNLSEQANDNFWVADPIFLTVIWIGIMFLLIICPFVATRERRSLCYRRIVERSWNIDGVRTPSIIPSVNIVVRSYPVGDPRHRFTKEEAKEETKKFILEQLEPFTKTLHASDFIKENGKDVETGSIKYSLVRDLSSEHLTNSTNDSSMHSVDEINKPSTVLATSGKEVDEEVIEKGEATSSLTERNVQDSIDTEKQGLLRLPGPGISFQNATGCSNCKKSALQGVEGRSVNAECSICLTAYSVGDKVSWSALDCHHVFHQECMAEWLMTLGQKSISAAQGHNNTVIQGGLCNYSMYCPVCRQDFIPNLSTST